MTYELVPWVEQTLKVVGGPLAGALVGALAAQGIAKRNADVLRDLQEMRATNLAISATSSLVNVVAAVKRQHIAPLTTGYAQVRAALDKARITKAKPFEFQADLHTVPPLITGLPMLEKLLYERISVPPGAMGLYALVAQAAGQLNATLETRNAIILSLKANAEKSSAELSEIYFGLPNQDGHTDTRYRDSMSALKLYTDDIILFGMFLAKELVKHASSLYGEGRRGFPAPARPDFKALEDAGLMPPVTDLELKILASLQIDPEKPA